MSDKTRIMVIMDRDPKNLVRELVQLLGKRKAVRLLIAHDVSPSTASKLSRGKYESEIGPLMAAAIRSALESVEKQAS